MASARGRRFDPIGVIASVVVLGLVGAGAAASAGRAAPGAGDGSPDGSAAAGTGTAAPLPDPAPWQRTHLWDDGLAEVSRYRARLTVEGHPRDFTDVFVVVKEDLDPDSLVKSEAPADASVPVLKVNEIRSIPAGVARYHQMLSSFLARTDLAPVRLAFSSTEWCGIAYKAWRRDTGALAYDTYFDGMAHGTHALLASAHTLFYDDLPVALRGLAARSGGRYTVDLVDTLFSPKAPAPVILPATIEVGATAKRTVPAGTIEARKITVTRGRRIDTLWFRAKGPYPLVEWDRADGGRFTLADTRRVAYWKLDKPGDALPALPAPAAPAATKVQAKR